MSADRKKKTPGSEFKRRDELQPGRDESRPYGASPSCDSKLEALEFRLLLEAIFQQYGWDFREYAPASLKRRIRKSMQNEKTETISRFQEKILHAPDCMERFLLEVSISVTSMFRNPLFFLELRNKVVSNLKDQPLIRIWTAGCGTGEEVYSLAIVLKEENLLDKCRIYATDMNEAVLAKAKEGIFSLENMAEYTNNYIKAGGKDSFSEYYTAKYGNAIFKPGLKKNLVFAHHNLVTDASFNEFQIILCRNVMIYFNKDLQNRIHKLLYASLAWGGVLCLGSKESLKFTAYEDRYASIDEKEKIYRKVK